MDGFHVRNVYMMQTYTLHLLDPCESMFAPNVLMDGSPWDWYFVIFTDPMVYIYRSMDDFYGKLVGWTNPFEKYDRQIGSSPQIGMNITTLWFWGFWGSLAPHLVGKYIIPGSLAPPIVDKTSLSCHHRSLWLKGSVHGGLFHFTLVCLR